MLSVEDICDILSIPLIGVIPESKSVLKASNVGSPVINDKESIAGKAYEDAVQRFLGQHIPMRFTNYKKPSLIERIFGRKNEPETII